MNIVYVHWSLRFGPRLMQNRLMGFNRFLKQFLIGRLTLLIVDSSFTRKGDLVIDSLSLLNENICFLNCEKKKTYLTGVSVERLTSCLGVRVKTQVYTCICIYLKYLLYSSKLTFSTCSWASNTDLCILSKEVNGKVI